MKSLVLFISCIVGMSAAFPYSYWPWSAYPYTNAAAYSPYYNPYHWYYANSYAPFYTAPNAYAGVAGAGGQKQAFYGEFKGTCDGAQDGLYYVDDRSFAYCSGGQKTVQPCSEGTSNPPVTAFTAGELYGFFDFCSVNLLAGGYGYPFAAFAPGSAHAGIQQYPAPPPANANYDAPKGDNKHPPAPSSSKHEPPKEKY